MIRAIKRIYGDHAPAYVSESGYAEPSRTITPCCEESKRFITELSVTLEGNGKFEIRHWGILLRFCPACGVRTGLEITSVERYRKEMVETEKWVRVEDPEREVGDS